MLKKISVTLLVVLFVFADTAHAYDLPQLKPDKKVAEQKKASMLKSDWQGAELFEQRIKILLASGKELAPNDPVRVPTDKNYVFVAFYNDAPYFLDKYSIKIRKNSDAEQVWEQNIFPISKGYSPKNATSTHQKFCFSGGQIFNSTKAKDALSEVEDEAGRKFLAECFKVGYYFAFGKEATGN